MIGEEDMKKRRKVRKRLKRNILESPMVHIRALCDFATYSSRIIMESLWANLSKFFTRQLSARRKRKKGLTLLLIFDKLKYR